MRRHGTESGIPLASSAAPGYTLVEILVAMTLLVILGTGLTSLLGQGANLWRRSETRGRIHESARAILDLAAADLRCAFLATEPRGPDVWIRFIADRSPHGGQRLRFVRTVGQETSDSVLREAGRWVITGVPKAYDGLRGAAAADAGVLAPSGGLLEVLWMHDPRPEVLGIWRGMRTPPGGAGSLFLEAPGAVAKPTQATKPTTRGPEPKPPVTAVGPGPASGGGNSQAEADPLSRLASLQARGVLHFGYRFWGPTTNTWREVPAIPEGLGEGESGPLDTWDSTRAILDEDARPGATTREFRWQRREGSLEDPLDDLLPSLVEVTLVLEDASEGPRARLLEPVGETATSFLVSGEPDLPRSEADRFVYIAGEWIAVAEFDGSRLHVAPRGRGRRWTAALRHEAGEELQVGTSFRRIVPIAASRPPVGSLPARETTGARRKR